MIHGVDARAADAALCLSELVANVVTHTHSDIEVDVSSDRGNALHVAVSDHSDDLPRAVGALPGQPAGRGLVVVHALAKEWGVTPHAGGGKTVWFDLD
jgi:anti-sigma regulatory factor (Ser/Thr protein kinase)